MYYLYAHKSQIYDECRTQSAKVLALPREWDHQTNYSDTLHPPCFLMTWPILWLAEFCIHHRLKSCVLFMLSYLQFTLEQTYGQSTIISGFFWTGLLKRLDQNEDGFIALSNIAIFQLDMVISIAPRDLQVAAIQNSLISIGNRNSHQCKNETKVTTCFLFSIRKISFVQI